MRKGFFLALVAALLALLTLPAGTLAHPGAGSPAWGKVAGEKREGWTWHTETVDGVGNVGEYSSLALDGSGRPRISYYGSSALKLASFDGGAWQVQALDAAGDVGLFSAIAIYGAGNVGISYYDATNGDLKYWWQGAAVAVDTAGDVGKYTSLAFDSSSFPHISYYDAGSGDLKHAYQDGSGWHVQTLAATGDVGRYTSIALRLDNNWASVSYYDASSGSLQYYWQDTFGPNFETVESGASAGQWSSLALDSGHWPHIVYASGGGANLKYAYKDASGWHISLLDVNTSGHTSLKLDAGDRPHVSYWKDGELRYAYHDGATWHYETVDAAGDVGAYSSLALDSQGRVGISYRDASNMDLKYAYSCCRAAFSAAPLPQCERQPVAFTNETAGFGPFTYLWAFGDGTTSTQEDPTHSYDAGGVYGVLLTSTASCGADTFNSTVVISSTPEASFSFGPDPICAGSTPVQFTNTTVTSPTTTYQWAFGDGTFSTLENPTHTYTQAGEYEAVLIATNSCGLDVALSSVRAHGGPEVAASWSPDPPQVGNVVTFTAQATSTLPVLSYAWDFGDGGLGSGQLVQHTYAATGTYSVSFTATNECAAGSGQADVTVVCYPVTATAFTWDPPTPTVGAPLSFLGSASGTGPFAYAWDFGDGSAGSGQLVQHTYAATGTFTVLMTATNFCGQQQASREILVVALPRASFASNSPACLGAALAFTNSSSGAQPLAFAWDFGDGETSTETSPLHTYAQAGPYTVQLTASNAYGADSVTATVEVWGAPLSATFAFAPDYPAPGAVVTFSAAAGGGHPAPQFSWSFGDGYTSTGQVVIHSYALTGTYTVLLEAGGSCGVLTATRDVEVAFCAQPAGLEVAHSAPLVAGEPATFSATLAAGSAPLTFGWDLGDGSPQLYGPPVVTHTYAAAGAYTVSVAAWNRCGVVGPLSLPVQVEQGRHAVHLPLVFKSFYRGDGYEPDNTPAQGRVLPLSTPQRHDFAPQGDVDWVYLVVAEAGTFQVRTFNLGGGADTRLFLYDALGNLLASNDDCPGGQPPDHLASCVTLALPPGRYDLLVDQSPGAPGGPKWGPQVQYTLEATSQ